MIVDLRAEVFLILYIQKLKICISLVWKALYIRKFQDITLIMKISLVDNLTNFFCKKIRKEEKIQSLGVQNSVFMVLILSLVLRQQLKL